MQGIDWRRKLTSRKFWMSIAGLVSGLIAAFGGTEEVAKQVSGLILAAASVFGYMLAEGLVDAESAQYVDEPEKLESRKE